MAIILNIETSTKNCSVSIAENGKLIALVEENDEGYAHGEKLHQFIQWAIEGTNYQLKDLNAIAVSKGPGSYTGLRIGVSAAKGLAFALEIPLISINSIQIIASAYKNQKYDYIIPMIDARRMEVYTALYNPAIEEQSPTEAKVIDENSFEDLINKKLLIVGDGALKTKEILTHLEADYLAHFPSAKEMCELSYTKFIQNNFEDVAYFEPFYLKDFVAGKKKNES